MLHCGVAEATARLTGAEMGVRNYTVQASSVPAKLRVDASIGLRRACSEKMEELVERADAEMYR